MSAAWPMHKLGDLCSIQIGKTPARATSAYWGPGHPWLSIADMNQGADLFSTKETITEQAIKDCHCRMVEPGTALMSFKLTVGRVGVARVPMFTNEAIAHLPINDPSRLDVGYLCRALERLDFSGSTDRAAMGATLNKASLHELPIPLPPIDEQRRIAAILDKADEVRAKRRAALETLETLSQAIFIDMFGDPFLNGKNFPVARLDEVTSAINDCPHSTPKWEPEGMVCLRTSNLGRGRWIWRDTRYVSPSAFEIRSSRGYLETGDIVLSREGTVGIAACVEEGMRLCMGQRLVQVRADSDIVRPGYLLPTLLALLQPSRISSLMVGSTATHLNVRDLRAMPVPLPPVTLQDSFLRISQRLVATRNAMESESRTGDLFASLQQRAFQGAL